MRCTWYTEIVVIPQHIVVHNRTGEPIYYANHATAVGNFAFVAQLLSVVVQAPPSVAHNAVKTR